jgi:CDP-diacylglycerol---glycerol-3-phosphate 3-phosphatidyltransferase
MLSLSRIPSSLFLLLTYNPSSRHWLWLSVATVLFIMTSDFLDGRIARKYHVESKLGYVLDGLGDRAFHAAACLMLLLQDVIGVILAWILILREISQYAVRLAHIDWHSTQSRFDRLTTQSFTVVIQLTLLLGLLRELATPSSGSSAYILIANVLLWLAAVASFCRIVPQLMRAWLRAAAE